MEAQSSFRDRLKTMKLPDEMKEEYKKRVKNKKGRMKTREADRLKRKADGGPESEKARAIREKMRGTMKKAGFSAAQFTKGLLMKVESKSKKLLKPKKKLEPRRLEPRSLETRAA